MEFKSEEQETDEFVFFRIVGRENADGEKLL